MHAYAYDNNVTSQELRFKYLVGMCQLKDRLLKKNILGVYASCYVLRLDTYFFKIIIIMTPVNMKHIVGLCPHFGYKYQIW